MTDNARPEQESRATPREALEEFETRLGARTKVPAERLEEFLSFREEELRSEARKIGAVLRRFADAVVDSVEDPDGADRFLRDLDLKSISRDHDWRAIFSTMRTQSEGGREYKRAILVKYLQYLSFRKRLVEYIHARRLGLEETDESADLTRFPVGGDAEEGEFARLPLGETVELGIAEGTHVEIMLGHHVFRLVASGPPCLIDSNGAMCFLRPGRNLVGRHPESDVSVDPNLGHVSRAHMIVEWEPPETVRITDLSSRGTWLRPDVLTEARAIRP